MIGKKRLFLMISGLLNLGGEVDGAMYERVKLTLVMGQN
jgi:hypothetical protein